MGKPEKTSTGEDLHSAARSGDLNAVRSILSLNPLAVNSRDKHSRTPLHLASWSGQAEVVKHLCKHKADVGAAAMDDMGAIHFAAQKGHLEVIRTLLSSGVSNKTSTRKGLTPLHYAVQGSHLELVKYLVRKGASLNAKTKAGKTPLDLAGNEEIRTFLEEWERSPMKSNTQRVEESDPKPSVQEQEENSGDEGPSVMHEKHEPDGEGMKWKGDNDDRSEPSSETKKARIALNHLLSADDTHEDDENL